VAGRLTGTPETLGNTVPCKATTTNGIKFILPAGPTAVCWTAVNTRSQNFQHGYCSHHLHSKVHSIAPVLPNSRVTIEKMWLGHNVLKTFSQE